MLDSDLAGLYSVPTGRLNEQVKRNIERFPNDFAFQLTGAEFDSLRSQIATLKDGGRGRHRKYLPYVFTEHGVAMLSSVLRSKRAVQVNIEIIRAFVLLRQMLATNEELARKVQQLDRKVAILYDNFQRFIAPPNTPEETPHRLRSCQGRLTLRTERSEGALWKNSPPCLAPQSLDGFDITNCDTKRPPRIKDAANPA